MSMGWDYPPGVTGNEPQISGEWPCDCGDNCEQRETDCCEEPRFTCETAFVLDANDDPDVLVCKRGFGCNQEER